jgi:hypothetical protein
LVKQIWHKIKPNQITIQYLANIIHLPLIWLALCQIHLPRLVQYPLFYLTLNMFHHCVIILHFHPFIFFLLDEQYWGKIYNVKIKSINVIFFLINNGGHGKSIKSISNREGNIVDIEKEVLMSLYNINK